MLIKRIHPGLSRQGDKYLYSFELFISGLCWLHQSRFLADGVARGKQVNCHDHKGRQKKTLLHIYSQIKINDLFLQEQERGKTKCAKYWPDQDSRLDSSNVKKCFLCRLDTRINGPHCMLLNP